VDLASWIHRIPQASEQVKHDLPDLGQLADLTVLTPSGGVWVMTEKGLTTPGSNEQAIRGAMLALLALPPILSAVTSGPYGFALTLLAALGWMGAVITWRLYDVAGRDAPVVQVIIMRGLNVIAFIAGATFLTAQLERAFAHHGAWVQVASGMYSALLGLLTIRRIDHLRKQATFYPW